MNVFAAHRDRQDLGLETLAAASGTGDGVHEVLIIGIVGLRIAALQQRDHTLEHCRMTVFSGAHLIGLAVAVQQSVQCLFGKFLYGRVQREAVCLSQLLEGDAEPRALVDALEAVDRNAAVPQRVPPIQDTVRRKHGALADARAVRTRAERTVEGKHAGGKLAEADIMLLAREALGKGEQFLLPLFGDEDMQISLRQIERRFHRIGETGADVRLHHQTVHHHLHGVLHVLVQLDVLAQVVQDAVHPHPHIAALFGVRKHLFVSALLGAHHGGKHQKAGAFGELHHTVDDLIGGLL